ncbi:MAG: MT-A70 family methyltransferase [Halopseudomonas aestusnigri]
MILPSEKYGVIYADPPWTFKTFSKKGEGKSPQANYDCMSIKDICHLPVGNLAAKDCALLMWCTWPMIFEAKTVAEAWGFKYSGLAWEWIKYNPDTGKYAFGGGYGTRKNLEPCLLFRRGKPKALNRSTRDFIFAKRREHSRKPDEAYPLIENLFKGPYVELFARQQRPGWDAWGNQTDKFGESQ